MVFGDRVLGVLAREDLLRTLAQHGSNVPVREAMRRDVQSIDSHDMLERAIAALRTCKCRSLPVEHNGHLVGMLTLDNVGEFIMIESALRQARGAGDGQKPQ